jgi:rhamnose utilization protein RhaD (predicted bifunctional aldolase and dehydrogenase)
MLRGAVAVDGVKAASTGWCRSSAHHPPSSISSMRAPTFADMADGACRRPDLSIRIKTGPDGAAGAGRRAIAGLSRGVANGRRLMSPTTPLIFRSNDARDDVKRTMLDPMPRLTLVPGFGMFGHGRT